MAWLKKGSLAILDQGLSAGSNFVLNVLLARWLTPEQYGAYALAYACFLLPAGLYDSLLVEPMSVLGPTAFSDRRRHYLGALLGIHVRLGLAVLLVLGVAAALAGGVFGSLDLARALGGVALAAPCILLFWLARGACYLDLAPGPAARGAVLYTTVAVGGLWVIHRAGRLSPFSLFLLMGAASLVVAAFLLGPRRPAAPTRSPLAEVWNRHWSYGRWEVGSAVVSLTTQNASYALTGAFLGMAQVGGLKALANLLLPVGHTVTALRRLAQPYVSGVSGRQGSAATRAPVTAIAWLFAAGGLAYCAALSLFRVPLLELLYGGHFTQFAPFVPGIALCMVFSSGAYAFLLGLRAMQRLPAVFATYCAEAVVLVACGLPAAWKFGLAGIIGALALASLTRLVMSALVFRRATHV